MKDKLCNTHDSGRTWNITKDNISNFSFVFVDPMSGWGNGHENDQNSKLLRTSDGGKTWRIVLNTESSIGSISFSETGVGLLSTFQSGIFRCDASFEKWSQLEIKRTLGESIDEVSGDFSESELLTGLKYVGFLQDNKILGFGNGIWLSTDGGINWKNKVPVGESGSLNNASFYDDFVWIVGNSKYVFFTDGETRWERHEAPITGYSQPSDWLSIEAVSFISAVEGWVVRNDKAVFHTKDGAKSWTLVSRPSYQLREIKFISSKLGWAVSENGELFRTENGGITWKVQNINS